MRTHLVVPDPHAHYLHNNGRADLLANLIIDERPDVVICLGDGADMPSLSGYDKGKKTFQGRTYQKDIEAWLDFQHRMWDPVKKRKKKLPETIYLIGNHEERIDRAIQLSPELEGAIGYSDLDLDSYWNTVVPYDGRTPGVISIDGIHYAHYFVSGVMGKPISGERPAYSLISKQYKSCTQGHTHLLDYSQRTTVDGNKVAGLVGGIFTDFHMDWAGTTQNLWWSGVVIKRNVRDGFYDPQFVSLETLKKEYA